MPTVGLGCPGQRTITSGLWRARKISMSCAFHASSNVCISSVFVVSMVVSIWSSCGVAHRLLVGSKTGCLQQPWAEVYPRHQIVSAGHERRLVSGDLVC